MEPFFAMLFGMVLGIIGGVWIFKPLKLDKQQLLVDAEKTVRAKIAAELRSSAFMYCDVNKEDVLLCIKHGCTLREAKQRENEGDVRGSGWGYR